MQATTTPVQISMADQIVVPRASAVAFADVANDIRLRRRTILTTVRLISGQRVHASYLENLGAHSQYTDTEHGNNSELLLRLEIQLVKLRQWQNEHPDIERDVHAAM